MTQAGATTDAGDKADLAALARGGRINFMGFVMRLIARLPFLFIAGRFYGAEALGRFAYAVLIVEFAAQLATLGLKRGLARQLSTAPEEEHTGICWDAILVAAMGSGLAMVVFIVATAFDYRWLKTLVWPIYALCIGLLVLTLAIGDGVGGSARWVSLGPFTFQFSELAKILMIIVLAVYLGNREGRLDSLPSVLGACALTAP